MDENKYGLIIVGIVALIAVVSVVFMSGGKNNQTSVGDATALRCTCLGNCFMTAGSVSYGSVFTIGNVWVDRCESACDVDFSYCNNKNNRVYVA